MAKTPDQYLERLLAFICVVFNRAIQFLLRWTGRFGVGLFALFGSLVFLGLAYLCMTLGYEQLFEFDRSTFGDDAVLAKNIKQLGVLILGRSIIFLGVFAISMGLVGLLCSLFLCLPPYKQSVQHRSDAGAVKSPWQFETSHLVQICIAIGLSTGVLSMVNDVWHSPTGALSREDLQQVLSTHDLALCEISTNTKNIAGTLQQIEVQLSMTPPAVQVEGLQRLLTQQEGLLVALNRRDALLTNLVVNLQTRDYSEDLAAMRGHLQQIDRETATLSSGLLPELKKVTEEQVAILQRREHLDRLQYAVAALHASKRINDERKRIAYLDKNFWGRLRADFSSPKVEKYERDLVAQADCQALEFEAFLNAQDFRLSQFRKPGVDAAPEAAEMGENTKAATRSAMSLGDRGFCPDHRP